MKRKSSQREEAAESRVNPAFSGIALAAERIGPMVHQAAERVTPLAHSAADKVRPLAHTAADRVVPLAHTAADRVVPLAHSAVDRVSPYAYQVVGYVSPYAHQAADRVAPLAANAKVRGTKLAHSAADRIGPRLDEAWVVVAPVIEAGRERVNEDLRPRVTGALTAAAASPLVVEAGKRGRATLAAARGELDFPAAVEDKSSKGGRLKWLAILAALGGVAFVVVKKLLGTKDADWQAARPASTFPSSKPAGTTSAAGTAASSDAAQEPLNWAEATGQTGTVPSQPLDEASEQAIVTHVGEPSDAPAEAAPEATVAEGLPEDRTPSTGAAESPAASTGVVGGDDAYTGSEPPEGFAIKGNQNSMKYHLPDSPGYESTVAEVWFRTEEAARQAGFVRAQG
ncbi:MAG TPA: hypothetical protein VFP89_03770 [Propionibacteriaceae bacterium]|nr:hypothetical protein [Propionibacteriaceae bacterium]